MFGKDKSILKFGYSAVLASRIANYVAHNPLIEVVGTYYREDAKEFENLFHKKQKAIIRREYYAEEYLEEIIHCIENIQPLINIDNEDVKQFSIVEKATYTELVEYFKIFVNSKAETIDWGKYSNRPKWIEIIEKCWKLYGKTWNNISTAIEMIEHYTKHFQIIGMEVNKLFKIGARYSRSDIKNKLTNLYKSLSIDKKGNYADLNEYFITKEIKVNGVRFLKIMELISI